MKLQKYLTVIETLGLQTNPQAAAIYILPFKNPLITK